MEKRENAGEAAQIPAQSKPADVQSLIAGILALPLSPEEKAEAIRRLIVGK